MNRINLLPDSYLEACRRSRTLRAVAGAAVATVVVGTCWAAVAYRQARGLSEQIAAAQARLVEHQQRAGSIELASAELKTLKGILAHRRQLEAPVAAPGALALLTHLLPESVVLTRLSWEAPPVDLVDRSKPENVPAAAPAGVVVEPPATRLKLEGLALSDVELAHVVSVLASQEGFANVKLVRSKQVATGDVVGFGFEITLDVPPSAAAPTRTSLGSTAESAENGGRRGV